MSAWPLTQPNYPTRLETIQVTVHHCLTLPSHPQSQWVHTTPVCLPLRPYCPSDFKHPGPSWCCSKLPVWQGRGPVDPAFSHESCGRPSWCQAWGCSCPGPSTGLRNLIVPKQSPYRLIFQCPLLFWPPNFIYGGIPLVIHSVPQKIG